MIRIVVPGYINLSIDHLVLDYNGTLAQDGQSLGSTKELLNELADRLELHIVTADTFGSAKPNLNRVRCRLTVLSNHGQAEAKQQYIYNLGCERTIAIGNGRNDQLMVKAEALGIVVLGKEGTAVKTLLASDIVCASVLEALELLLNPKRLVATLRS